MFNFKRVDWDKFDSDESNESQERKKLYSIVSYATAQSQIEVAI